MKKLIPTIAIITLGFGCTTARIQFSDGSSASLTRPSFLSSQAAFATFSARSTNGAEIKLEGYKRQDQETTSALIQAVVEGAVKGAKISQGIP